MTIYLPIVPSSINSFDPLPIVNIDDPSDPFGTQLLNRENLLKIYYNVSPLNSENDYTHVAIRFLSIAANRNPLVDPNRTYPYGIYIAPKEEDSNGTYIKIPAHLFIKTGGTVSVNAYKIPTKGASYAQLEYTDLLELDAAGIGLNEYYRAQIKLLNFGAGLPRTTSSVSNAYPRFANTWYQSFPVNTNARYTAGQQSIILAAVAAGSYTVSAGAAISGYGIYPNTYLSSATPSTGEITLSKPIYETIDTDKTLYVTYNQAPYSPSALKTVSNLMINPTGPSSNVSEWSSQIAMKPIVIGDLEDRSTSSRIGIKNFISRNTTSGVLITTNQANAEFYSFEFFYPPSTQEKVQSYRFQIYEESDLNTPYEDSGTIEVQQYLVQSSISYTNEKELDNGATYYLAATFTTVTGFKYTKRYQFTPVYSVYPLGITFDARSDNDNGRIEFQIVGRQVRFIPNDNLYDGTSFKFINSDNQASYSSSTVAYKQNSMYVINDKIMKNKQKLIFEPDFGSWSIQMIVSKINPKTDGPLDTSDLDSDYMFKLIDTESAEFEYYLIPVSYDESIPTYVGIGTASVTTSYLTRSYNEFNLVKKVSNSSQGLKTFYNINNGNFSRVAVRATPSSIITTYTAYMNEADMTLGGYDLLTGVNSTVNSPYSSFVANRPLATTADTGSTILYLSNTASIEQFMPVSVSGDNTSANPYFANETTIVSVGTNSVIIDVPTLRGLGTSTNIRFGDNSNKYYLYFGEQNGKMFLYSQHLNPNATETETKDRLNR